MTIKGTKPMPYITITYGLRGWFAVIFWYNTERDGIDIDFWEPWQSSDLSFEKKEDAIAYGKQWATNEGLEFKE